VFALLVGSVSTAQDLRTTVGAGRLASVARAFFEAWGYRAVLLPIGRPFWIAALSVSLYFAACLPSFRGSRWSDFHVQSNGKKSSTTARFAFPAPTSGISPTMPPPGRAGKAKGGKGESRYLVCRASEVSKIPIRRY
jgi:hypothetical protein